MTLPQGTTVTISSGGVTTGPFPVEHLEAVHEAVAGKLRRGRDPKRDDATAEMWSDEESGTRAAGTIAAGQLRAIVERIERFEEDRKEVADDIADVYAEAKGAGFDVPIMRTLVRMRRKEKAVRDEEEAILDLYKSALGM